MNSLSGPIKLIKQSLEIFFRSENFVYFLKIYAALIFFAALFLAQSTLLAGFNVQSLSLSSVESFIASYGWIVGVGVLVNLIYLFFSFWVSAAGICAVDNVITGRSVDFKETMVYSWRKLWKFSLLSILVGLIIGAGFLLLIVPGILFMVWFRFSSFEFMTKNVSIKEAISNSKKLISGKFWKVFGRLIVFELFGACIQIILSFIPLGIGSLLAPMALPLMILPFFLLYRELVTAAGSNI